MLVLGGGNGPSYTVESEEGGTAEHEWVFLLKMNLVDVCSGSHGEGMETSALRSH